MELCMGKFVMAIAIFAVSAFSMEENRAALFDPKIYAENSQMQKRWAGEILKWLNLSSAKNMLDIGCGDGDITASIAKAYPSTNVIGLDISYEMVSYANKNHQRPKLLFIVGDAHRLPFKAQFDVITSFNTIHRLADPQIALAGIYMALRPGGKFIAAFPAKGSPIMSAAIAKIDSKPEWKHYFSNPDRKNYSLNDPTIEKWLIDAGFIVVKTQTKWEDEIFQSKDNFRDLLRATSSHRLFLPKDKEAQFFEEVVDEYLTNSPLDEKQQVHFYFNRMEIVAVKPQARL